MKALLLVVCLFAGVDCAWALTFDDDGFSEPHEEVIARVKRIGILPLELPTSFGSRDELIDRYETAVSAKLNDAGFTAVGSGKYRQIFDAMHRQLGGSFDPVSGRRQREKYAALIEHALLRYILDEKLDGVLMADIVFTAADYAENAVWDGVMESPDGVPVSNQHYRAFVSPPAAPSGVLPALSLQLVLKDRVNRPLYARSGGVQLTAYKKRWTELTGELLRVPSNQLLRDLPRLERAIDVATNNLRKSAATRELERKAEFHRVVSHRPPVNRPNLPPLPAGETPRRDADDKSIVSCETVLSRVKSVAILPLALPGIENEADVKMRYSELIAAELSRVGITVQGSDALERIWNQVMDRSAGFYDPYTGVRDIESELAVRREVFSAFTKEVPVDAILWPMIERRTAWHNGGNASWDGVTQSAITLKGVEQGAAFSTGSWNARVGTGRVAAISLDIIMLTPADELLYWGIGGVQVIERIAPSALYFDTLVIKNPIPIRQFFTDADRDRNAVRIALRALVLTPEELKEEINPSFIKRNRPKRRKN